MIQNNEALLAKYNAIENELIANDGHRNTLFIFSFTSVGAILSFSLQDHNSYIAVVAVFVLICVKCRIFHYRDSSLQRYAYIKYVLEPKLKIDLLDREGIEETWTSQTQYFSFTLMALGSVMTYLTNKPNEITSLLILILLSVLVFFLDIYYLNTRQTLLQKARKIYQNNN